MTGSKRDEGAAALVGQKADARHADQQTANGNKQGSEPKGAISLPLKQPPANSEAAIGNQKTQTEQPSQYDLRDLAAQEDMAFWAMWMFVAALATFAITSFGTLLIWRQVKLTRQAVEDTGQATDAMRESNTIATASLEQAKIANELSSRPFLDFDCTLASGIFYRDGRLVIRIGAEIFNSGSGLAKSINFQPRLFLTGPDEEGIPEFFEMWKTHQEDGSDAGFLLRPGCSHNGEFEVRIVPVRLKNAPKVDDSTLLIIRFAAILTYRWTGSENLYYVTKSYGVDRDHNFGEGRIWLEDGDIPIEQLRLGLNINGIEAT